MQLVVGANADRRYGTWVVSVDYREGQVTVARAQNDTLTHVRFVPGSVLHEQAEPEVGALAEVAKDMLGRAMPDEVLETDGYGEPFGKGPSDHPADAEV